MPLLDALVLSGLTATVWLNLYLRADAVVRGAGLPPAPRSRQRRLGRARH